MGRHLSKKSSFSGGILKLGIAAILVFGIIYGISYGTSLLSRVTLGDIYDKTEPVSQVAGEYIDKIPFPKTNTNDQAKENKKVVLKVGILSDSHNDNDNLELALDKVKESGIQTVLFLGDYSNAGSLEELNAAKKVMDSSFLTYYSLPGDHDLWKSVGPSNFVSVFGPRYQIVTIDAVKFILIDNSDNSKGVDKGQLDFFTIELAKLKKGDVGFVFMSNPLYNSTGFKLMGENNEEVSKQAGVLLGLIRSSYVKAVISGDNHLSSKSIDPENKELEHIVVGALTKERNLQSPRFDILEIYEDHSYRISETTL